MMTQCSILESSLKSLTESQLKHLQGNASPKPYIFDVKQIVVILQGKPPSLVGEMVDWLKVNGDAKLQSAAQWQSQFFSNSATSVPPDLSYAYGYPTTNFPVMDRDSGLYLRIGDSNFWHNQSASIAGSGWFSNWDENGIYVQCVWMSRIRVNFSTVFTKNLLRMYNQDGFGSYSRFKNMVAPIQLNGNPSGLTLEYTIPMPDYDASIHGGGGDKDDGYENVFYRID